MNNNTEHLFNDLSSLIKNRLSSALLENIRPKNKSLRNFIFKELNNENNGVLGDIVVQANCPWKSSGLKLNDISYLNENFVQNINSESTNIYEPPYTHQEEAWRSVISSDNQVTVVTTGTGSGKTECFLAPVLNDLASQVNNSSSTLCGVQALFLYPLNALINSQKKRLNSWTKPFDNKIRYALYNGNTINSAKVDKARQELPQVISREDIRNSPPPILISNASMLEYMIVRKEDQSILEQSQGSLKYIIIDEAHSYIGSQSAEVAMLIRRLLKAFGVKLDDVKFIMTSATVGGSDGGKSLKEFVAKLTGVDVKKVNIITGERNIPEFNCNDELKTKLLDNDLCLDKAIKLKNLLINNGGDYKSINDISNSVSTSVYDTVKYIDLLSEYSNLPIRAHYFINTFSGIYACINSKCNHKNIKSEDWGYGRAFLSKKDNCACGAPIHKLVTCKKCNEHYVIADKNSPLESSFSGFKPYSFFNNDEYDYLDRDEEQREEIDESSLNSNKKTYIIIPSYEPRDVVETYIENTDNYAELDVYIDAMSYFKPNDGKVFEISYVSAVECPSCKYKSNSNFFSPLEFRSPFILSETLPSVLDLLPEQSISSAVSEDKNCFYFKEGRKLITFTDNRQGVSRLTMRLQQEAEDLFIKKLVYQTVLENNKTTSYDEWFATSAFASMDATARAIPSVKEHIDREYAKAKSKQNTLTLDSLMDVVLENNSFSNYLKFLKDTGNNSKLSEKKLAKVFLARELNSYRNYKDTLESIGFVRVSVFNKHDLQVPELFTHNSNSSSKQALDLFYNFIELFMQEVIRHENAIGMDLYERRYYGSKLYGGYVLEEDVDSYMNYEKLKGKKILHYLLWALDKQVFTRLKQSKNKENKTNSIEINDGRLERQVKECFEYVVAEVKKHLEYPSWDKKKEKLVLKLDSIKLNVFSEGWICPIWNVTLPYTVNSCTPFYNYKYLQPNGKIDFLKSPKIDLSVNMQQVLTSNNLWLQKHDDICNKELDNILYRSEEHTAQVRQKSLRDYEDDFNNNILNVLNCSTTMEMGIDLDGVGCVVMTNVPPHPANYLQRIGRAGRRSEKKAFSMTVCEQKVHDQFIFANPMHLFINDIKPTLELNNSLIIQKHINAFLLASFFKLHTVSQVKVSVGDFFLREPFLYYEFKEFLINLSQNETIILDIKNLVHETVLEETSIGDICRKSVDKLEEILEDLKAKNHYITSYICNVNKDSPFAKKLNYDKNRIYDGYLLGYLVTEQFLPSYSFPTNLLEFTINYDDNGSNNELVNRNPTREAYKAIFEYAPGTSIANDKYIYKVNKLLTYRYFDQHRSQNIDKVFKCEECGHMHKPTLADIYKCEICDSGELSKYNVIQPKGFVADVDKKDKNVTSYSKTSYRDAEKYIFVKEQAKDYNKNIRFSYSDEAEVLNMNLISSYSSVCLACGDVFEFSSTQHQHKCNLYNESGFNIQELDYAAFYYTQAIEIFFPKTNRNILETLALTIRRSLCNMLGVDDREIDYFIPKMETSVILYDISAGGAGYVSQLQTKLKDVFDYMLLRENNLLVCDCDKGCVKCIELLQWFSSSNVESQLNRKETCNYLKHILQYSEEFYAAIVP